MANIPKIQKALYPYIPKIDPSIPYPFKVTTDTINHSSCMTKHIFPNNFNICYCIYLKLIGINGLDRPDAIILYLTIYIHQ